MAPKTEHICSAACERPGIACWWSNSIPGTCGGCWTAQRCRLQLQMPAAPPASGRQCAALELPGSTHTRQYTAQAVRGPRAAWQYTSQAVRGPSVTRPWAAACASPDTPITRSRDRCHTVQPSLQRRTAADATARLCRESSPIALDRAGASSRLRHPSPVGCGFEVEPCTWNLSWRGDSARPRHPLQLV